MARTLLTPLARATLVAQSGTISAAQALSCGMSRGSVRALVDGGCWIRLARGIFNVDAEPSRAGLLWGGVLHGGAAAVVGDLAAAHLHGLGEWLGWPVTIRVGHDVVGAAQPWWRFLRAPRTGRGDPPRTGVEDTLLDCWRHVTADSMAAMVGKAIADRLTTQRRLVVAVQARRRLARRAELRELLGDAGVGALSPLERRYLRDVERPHALPRGRRQASVLAGCLSDVLYEAGLLVELDGRLGHEGRFRDRRRDNAHLAAGLPTLRYGWADVAGDPCGVAGEVGSVLAQCDPTFVASRCPRCAARFS